MRVSVAALTGWSLLLAASLAAGDPARPKLESRAEFDQGVALFEQGAFERALARFRLSLAIYPTLAATTNAALCLKNLGRFDEALDTLDGLPQRFPGLTPDERQEYESEIAELSKQVGMVEVRGEPGARVEIDGIDRGRAPLPQPLRVMRGPHRVRIRRAGGEPFDQFIEVAPGRAVTLDVLPKRVEGEKVEPAPPVPPPTREAPPTAVALACPLCSATLEVGWVVTPTLGGDVAGCKVCEKSPASGGRILGRATYGLGQRWAVALEGGYLAARQQVTQRNTSASPRGLPANQGTADDAVVLRGALIGASVIFQPEVPVDVRLRLGMGTFLATAIDERSGSFIARSPPPYDVPPTTQHRGGEYVYLALSAGVGIPLGGHWKAGAGVDVSTFLALRQPVWDPRQNFSGPDGDTHFGQDSLTGRLFVAVTPFAGLGYEF